MIDAAFQKLTAEAIAKGIVQHLGMEWIPAVAEEMPSYNLKIVDKDAGIVTDCTIEQENRNGTVWTPIRQVVEALGYQVGYDSANKCVVVYK